MSVLLALALSVVAFAGPAAPAPAKCDPKPIQKELAEASPTGVPAVYQKLVACDAAVAKTTAPDALKKMLAGEATNPALVSAIGVGASDAVRAWFDTLEPDQRSATVAWMGAQCKSDATVEQFLVDTHAAKGAKFFEERWHRGLAECRTPKIQELLSKQLEAEAAGVSKPGADRSQFLGVLEVYSRNLGAAAIPTLGALGTSLKEDELLTYVVNAFADAANVGSAAGIDAAAATKAVAELEKIGPNLPPKAVEQARTTLLALGAEQTADSFAKYRWKDRMKDGTYRYAVVAVETMTCKNGKKLGYYHSADVSEPGRQWPSQLEGLIGEKLQAEWHLGEAAAKCKGTGEITYTFAPEPLADDAAAKAWYDAQKKAFDQKTAGWDKATAVEHEPVEM
jgi:hypothetical protein